MSLHTCLELPNQAAIAYQMALDQAAKYSWLVHRGNPTVTRYRRLWPLVSMQWYSEWCGIILTHGQGR